MNHLGTKVLETERLILRPFALSDAQTMFRNWASDPEVTKYLLWKPHPDIAETERVLGEWVPQYEKPNYYQWAIVLKSLGEPIGSLGAFQLREDVGRIEVGYCIGRKFWGRGYTAEALSEVIRFFFEEVGLNRVEATHDAANPNSGKVMRKCGLRYEGTKRKGGGNNTGICDMCFWGILAEDYFCCQSCGV
ncbi:MAG: GNAT family N-acetyltransferase, partial [Firmicutes bacterium]|nr:GNAT family N-acetyltransferase [Bacillota bacterium]